MDHAQREELEGVPEPGSMILGKFRVERVLGVGGMGCVVAARHVTLDQHVAIKFLLSSAAKNPKNLQRFQREAQAAAKIKSDHVAKVSDVGALEDGTPYMVMEYLDGEDLSERLLRVGRLAVGDAVSWLLEACEALAEAHQAGIVHRDLKPANLYLARQPDGTERIKVLDFGISKMVTGGQDLTRTSALMGSPLYMSPEQMMSAKSADHRTDIWAIGCILFELLSGQPPFVGETLPEICSKILTAAPTPLSQLAPHVPYELVAVVDACLAKKPEERFQNLGALSVALATFAHERARRSAGRVCTILGLSDEDVAGMRPSSLPAWNPPPGLSTGNTTGSSSVPSPTGPRSVEPTGNLPRSSVEPTGAQPVPPTQPGGYPPPGGYASYAASAAPITGSSSQPDQGYAATGFAPNTLQSAPIGARVPPGFLDRAGGASTAAPVAQTMDDGPRRRSRAPLVAVVALGVALVGAGGAYLGLSRAPDPASTRAAAKTDGPATKPAKDEARSDEPSTSPAAVPAESAEPEATAEPVPHQAKDSKSPPAPPVGPRPGVPPVAPPPVAPPPPPPGPAPGHQVKDGDDLFN